MDQSEQALQYFTGGFNCSQAVFTAIAERHGFDKELTLKIAAGFGGGIARLQKTCGAVTGAVMAIGLISGSSQADDTLQKEKVYSLTREFIDRFNTKHGTLKCSELLGHSLSTEEDRKEARELNLFETVCNNCVTDAVKILDEMLREK
jgi:C_GCAxxG_C_C family probable redox protein